MGVFIQICHLHGLKKWELQTSSFELAQRCYTLILLKENCWLDVGGLYCPSLAKDSLRGQGKDI